MSLIALVPGMAWPTTQWFIMHWRVYGLSRATYYQLVGWRGMSGGLLIGIYMTIAIARPYKKDTASSTESVSDKPQ